MDYKFIQIPFFSNDPSFKLINFVKILFKYRCILEKLLENYMNCNSSNIVTLKRLDVEFKTHNSPKKRMNFLKYIIN